MRPLLLTATALVLAATVAPGCASTMTAGAYRAPGLTVAGDQTWDWGAADALPVGDTRLEADPFFQDHVLGAVEKALAGKGLVRSAAGTAPDLRVHYHASITTRLEVDRLDRDYGCTAPWCEPGVTEYEAGTLVLDVIDTRTNRIVWRGWAQDAVAAALANPDTMERQIQDAVNRMMLEFPRTR